MNSLAGWTIANSMLTALAADGSVCMQTFGDGGADVVVDVTAYRTS